MKSLILWKVRAYSSDSPHQRLAVVVAFLVMKLNRQIFVL